MTAPGNRKGLSGRVSQRGVFQLEASLELSDFVVYFCTVLRGEAEDEDGNWNDSNEYWGIVHMSIFTN